jgi:hypothetical protein
MPQMSQLIPRYFTYQIPAPHAFTMRTVVMNMTAYDRHDALEDDIGPNYIATA